MSDKLSQSEIDALFGAYKEGGESVVDELKAASAKGKVEYRQYDFDRPEKFSIDNLRSLEILSQTFAKQLGMIMTSRLRSQVRVEFKEIEQIPFTSEYADKMIKDYYAFCVTDLGHPDVSEIVVELDLAFVVGVHKKNLGGSLPKELTKRRPLSDFEQVSLTKILKTMIYEVLEISFANVVPLYPKFIAYETDSQLLKITSNNDMVALITFNVSNGDWETTVRLVIPFNSIEGIVDKLTAEHILEVSPNKKKKVFRKDIEKGLENVEEDVHVSIGNIEMTLDELSALSVGDVIKLNRKLNEPSKGYAAGIHKFDCIIGKDNSKKAFKFVKFLD